MDYPNSKPKLVGSRQQKLKGDKETAAIKIQAAFRGYHTRKEIENANENSEPINPKKFQNVPRKNKTESYSKDVDLTRTQRNDSKSRKEEKKSQDKSVNNDARQQNKNVSKSNSTKLKSDSSRKYSSDEKDIIFKEKAAVIIQASFRGYKTRQTLQRKSSRGQNKTISQNKNKKIAPKPLMNKKTEKDLEKAAITIQAGFRGYIARQNLQHNNSKSGVINKSEGNKKKVDNEDLDRAAAKIQASFRSYRARHTNKDDSRNETTEENNVDKEQAAIQIQAGFRGFKARKEMKEKAKAATTIQAGFRGYKMRKDRKEKEKAAEKIQAGYRSYKVRKDLEKKSTEPKTDDDQKDKEVERNNAASKIQAAFRSYIVRRGNV